MHCSAGVGRTGVVILSEIMIACLEHNEVRVSFSGGGRGAGDASGEERDLVASELFSNEVPWGFPRHQ